MSQAPDVKTYVKIPLIEQHKGMDWNYIEGDIDVPYLSGLESFCDVLLTGRLGKVVNRETPGWFLFMN